jgi:glycosyltransferase involved in cell wall biosynthesis
LRVLQKDEELRARFGESGRRRVAETFQMERMVSEYRKLYLDLAARRQVVLDNKAEEGSLRPA